MFERFTPDARTCVVLSLEAARQLEDLSIGPTHLVVGALRTHDPVVEAAIERLGLTAEMWAQRISDAAPRGPGSPEGHVPFGGPVKAILNNSLREALQLGHNYIGAEHILLAALKADDPAVAAALSLIPARPGEVRSAVISSMTEHPAKEPPTASRKPSPQHRRKIFPRPRADERNRGSADEPSETRGNVLRIFVSYAHRDERHRASLHIHLASARRDGRTVEWSDRQILPGTNWADEIDERLNEADVIVLLLSPDFLASDYCYGIEMARALERHRAGTARVVPVVVRPCDWHHEPISALQMLPAGAKPVTEWSNRDRAWLDVAAGLRTVISELLGGASNP